MTDGTEPNYLAIDLGAMTDLGVDGTARLEFFNDRLYSTSFTPRSFDAYLAALKAMPGAQIDEDGIIRVSERTGIEMGGAPGEHLAFKWFDECLCKEVGRERRAP